jgi:MFS family permease
MSARAAAESRDHHKSLIKRPILVDTTPALGSGPQVATTPKPWPSVRAAASMGTAATAEAASNRPSSTRRMSPTAAFYLKTSIAVSFLAGSSAPTPLYPLYQAEWGFSSIVMTIVFGIYALAVLSALLVVGRLSDHVGRRPVLLVATFAQAATMLVFATASGVPSLMIARVIQGLATGAALAAVGAGLLDLDKTRGATANAIAPMSGTATGAILAGFLVQYFPAPTHLVYLILGAVYVAQGIGVVFMNESGTPREGALASLKPQFSLPARVRDPMLRALPALVATWALAGFYAGLGPTLVRGLLGTSSALVGGLTLFVLAGSGGISVLLLQKHEPHRMTSIGAIGLLAGVAIAIAGLSHHSAATFFVGTALSGAGFGGAFQGAVRHVVTHAAPPERAGVLSVAFVVSYLAMGLPAIGAGYLIARYGNLLATAREFAAVVMILAALALLGALLRQK